MRRKPRKPASKRRSHPQGDAEEEEEAPEEDDDAQEVPLEAAEEEEDLEEPSTEEASTSAQVKAPVDEQSEDDEEQSEEEEALEEASEVEAEASEAEAEVAPQPISQEERAPFMTTGAGHEATEEYIIVPRDERLTLQIMSIAEFTEALSLRTEQIAATGMQGAMIEVAPEGATTAREIAMAEMKQRRCPLKIVRKVGQTVDRQGNQKRFVEIWSPNEMTHPPFQ